MSGRTVIAIIVAACFSMVACKKSNTPAPGPGNSNFSLDYGDSVFFLANNATDYIVNPAQPGDGKYYGFPEGIQIDENTGAVDITKSETGLRYRISFVPTGKTDSISTVIVISGINFLDGFYKLTGDDSIAHPIYNGRKVNAVPGVNNGSIFDEGGNCNNNGCTVNTADGKINLAETVRNGVFGTTPANNARQEFDMNYHINDKSNEAENTIRIKLYYFDTMADVTQEAYDIISSREGTIFGLDAVNLPLVLSVPGISVNSTSRVANATVKAAKPRPPCIFIVGH